MPASKRNLLITKTLRDDCLLLHNFSNPLLALYCGGERRFARWPHKSELAGSIPVTATTFYDGRILFHVKPPTHSRSSFLLHFSAVRRPESNAYLSRGFQEAAGFHAGLSQLVENLFCNQDVWGSSPQFSTNADDAGNKARISAALAVPR